jgi:hypothetical protein
MAHRSEYGKDRLEQFVIEHDFITQQNVYNLCSVLLLKSGNLFLSGREKVEKNRGSGVREIGPGHNTQEKNGRMKVVWSGVQRCRPISMPCRLKLFASPQQQPGRLGLCEHTHTTHTHRHVCLRLRHAQKPVNMQGAWKDGGKLARAE